MVSLPLSKLHILNSSHSSKAMDVKKLINLKIHKFIIILIIFNLNIQNGIFENSFWNTGPMT